MPRIAYVNGQYVPHAQASVHIEDRGLQFADSVYEVLAFIGGTIADETGHMDRLERSLDVIGMPLPMSRAAFGLVLREVARRNRLMNAMIYLQITRGQAARSFKIPATIRPGIIITMRPINYDLDKRKNLSKTAITVRDIRWERRDIKSTMLLAQVLALNEAALRGAQEALMVDEDGYVTEASSSNVWIVDRNGALVTRPTAGNMILKGVTRTVIQALCKKEKIKIIERPFTVEEAYKAKEVFTSACFTLFASIVEIDGRKIGNGKPGPVIAKLYDLYMDYVSKGKQLHWDAK